MKLNNKFKVTTSIVVAILAINGFGAIQQNKEQLVDHNLQKEQQIRGNGEGEVLGIYDRWIPYVYSAFDKDQTGTSSNGYSYGMTNDLPMWLNYRLDINPTTKERNYYIGLSFAGDWGRWVAPWVIKSYESWNADSDFWIRGYDIEDKEDVDASPGEIDGADPYYQIKPYYTDAAGNQHNDSVGYFYLPTEAEWTNYFTLHNGTLGLPSESGFTDGVDSGKTDYTYGANIVVKMPVVSDADYEENYLNNPSGGNINAYTINGMKQSQRFVVSEVYIQDYGGNDLSLDDASGDRYNTAAKSEVGPLGSYGGKDGKLQFTPYGLVDDRDDESESNSLDVVNSKDTALYLAYPEPEWAVSNLSSSPETGNQLTVTWDHTTITTDYSIVEGLSYELWGPSNYADTSTNTLWDKWEIDDSGEVRHWDMTEVDGTGNVPDTPTDPTETIVLDATSEWWDGTDDGDMNISSAAPVSVSFDYPYQLLPDHDYKIELKSTGSESALGIEDGFDWNNPSDTVDVHTVKYYNEQPVFTKLEVIREDQLDEDGNITFETKFSATGKPLSEFDGTGYFQTDMTKATIVDSDGNEYGSVDLTPDANGDVIDVTITSTDLPANANVTLGVRIDYGKDVGVVGGSWSTLEDTAITDIVFTTGSRGVADMAATTTSSGVSGTTLTDSTNEITVDVSDIAKIAEAGIHDDVADFDPANVTDIQIVDANDETIFYNSEVVGGIGDGSLDQYKLNITGLLPNKDYEMKALVTYEGTQYLHGDTVGTTYTNTIASTPCSFTTNTVGAYQPGLGPDESGNDYSLVVTNPVLDETTRSYSTTATLDFSISESDNETDIYDPTALTAVRVKDQDGNLIYEDTSPSNTNSRYTATFDINDMSAKTDYEFTIEADWAGGTWTKQGTEYIDSVSTGDRGYVVFDDTAYTSDVQLTKEHVYEGPLVELGYDIPINTFGYDYSDFKQIDIKQIRIKDSSNDEMMFEEIDPSNDPSGIISLDSGSFPSGATHTYEPKGYFYVSNIIDESGDLWSGGDTTTLTTNSGDDSASGGIDNTITEPEIKPGPFTPTLSNSTSNPDAVLSSDNISYEFDLSFDIDLRTVDASDLSYLKTTISSMELIEYDENWDELTTPAYVDDLSIVPTFVDGVNTVNWHVTGVTPNANHNYRVRVGYNTNELDSAGGIIAATVAYIESGDITVITNPLGTEDIVVVDDVAFDSNETQSTMTTWTLGYILSNDTTDPSYLPWELDRVEIQDDTGNVLASSTGMVGSLKVSSIEAGTIIIEQGWTFNIYTTEKTISSTDELAYQVEINQAWVEDPNGDGDKSDALGVVDPGTGGVDWNGGTGEINISESKSPVLDSEIKIVDGSEGIGSFQFTINLQDSDNLFIRESLQFHGLETTYVPASTEKGLLGVDLTYEVTNVNTDLSKLTEFDLTYQYAEPMQEPVTINTTVTSDRAIVLQIAPTIEPELVVDKSSITDVSFKFTMDFEDPSGLLNLDAVYIDVGTTTKVSETSTSATYLVEGLAPETDYGTKFQLTYSYGAYRVENTIDVTTDVAITTTPKIEETSDEGGSLWWLWLILILLIIGGVVGGLVFYFLVIKKKQEGGSSAGKEKPVKETKPKEEKATKAKEEKSTDVKKKTTENDDKSANSKTSTAEKTTTKK